MKYKKLKAETVLKADESYVIGEEFVKRAQKLTKGTMNQEAFDFYKKQKNWHLLPDTNKLVFFVDTVFESGGSQCVRYLGLFGADWDAGDIWLSYKFDGFCVAAVSQGTLESETKDLSSDPLNLKKAIELVKKEGYIIYKEIK